MDLMVFLRCGVGPYHYFYLVSFLDEVPEMFKIGARRISDYHASCQMNYLSTIFNHLLGRIFDVTSRTTSKGGVTDQFQNMDEILRVVKAMQISDKNKVAMPANWPNNEIVGDHVIIPPATDVKTAKERLDRARAGEFECFDWWLYHKKLIE